MVRCSSVRSSGVKTSCADWFSMRNDPPEVLFAIAVAICLKPFEYSRGSLAASHTHGHHAVARFAALQFAEDGGRQFRSGAAERMAQRDRAAINVDGFGIEPSHADYRQGLDGERLVQ